MQEKYAKEITEPSLQELEELARWYNQKLGNYPVIVGGWAAYCYTKGLGSKDIDVVFVDERVKSATLADYFYSHGYVERRKDFFDKEFVKIVKSGGREIEIIVDAVSSKRVIIFEGREARLPWSWAIKHSVEHKLGEASIYIPTVELLMTYKFGAVLGRNIQLKTGVDYEYCRSKLWKDVYDIVGLSKLKAEEKLFNKFLKESGLERYKDEIIQIIEDNFTEETRLLVKDATLAKVKKILEI